MVEARWQCGECPRRGRVCRVGGERERRRLRDRASSLKSGPEGPRAVPPGTWGGGGVPRRPWIRYVGVWRRQRLVVWVE